MRAGREQFAEVSTRPGIQVGAGRTGKVCTAECQAGFGWVPAGREGAELLKRADAGCCGLCAFASATEKTTRRTLSRDHHRDES